MDDIATKFEYLKETKNLIKQAINNKGVTVSDTDTFRSYADKISSITVGETINNQNKTITENGTYTADEGYTGLSEVVVNVPTSSVASTPQISPVGLRVWLDAINNQGGFTSSRYSGEANKWYPLVGINAYNSVDSSSICSFSEDSITFSNTNEAGYGFYGASPYFSGLSFNKDCTYELVFTLNKILPETQHIFGITDSGGNSIRVDKSGNLYGTCYVGKNKTFTISPYTEIPTGVRIYCCLRVKEGEIHFFNSYTGLNLFNTLEDNISDLPTCCISLGYRGTTLGKYASNPSCVSICSARMYTRFISDEEMMNNYKYDKERFNIPILKQVLSQ